MLTSIEDALVVSYYIKLKFDYLQTVYIMSEPKGPDEIPYTIRLRHDLNQKPTR